MSKLVKKEIIENFGGGAKSDIAGIYLPNGFVPESLNVDFSLVRGAARKRKGYIRKNSSAITNAPPITGIKDVKLGNVETKVVTGVPSTGSTSYLYEWDGGSTFTSRGTMSGGSSKNTLVDMTITRTDTDGFVLLLADGVALRKWDGYGNNEALDVDGTNGGGDLGIDYFKCKYVASFKNYTFFANTREGNDALADDWDATNAPIYKHNDTIVNEVFAVMHSGSALSPNDGGYATLSAGEYDVYQNELYVRCSADADPAANIIVQYRAHERVRWSKIGDAEDHDSTNFLDVVTEPGKEIMRIVPLRDLLMVYKEDSIWAIYYTGDLESPFGIYCIDHNTPCFAGFSVSDVKGEHFFLSEEGIQ